MEKTKLKAGKIHHVDCEPKWINLVPQFAEWIQYGTTEQRKIAVDEIKKMATVCDTVRQEQKKAKKQGKKNFTITFPTE